MLIVLSLFLIRYKIENFLNKDFLPAGPAGPAGPNLF